MTKVNVFISVHTLYHGNMTLYTMAFCARGARGSLVESVVVGSGGRRARLGKRGARPQRESY